ncbi:hypothetical protein H6G80_21755 [Nostoc sp. FACHB-87]|uniref:hypothetical protein n=1 Tax=Nostocaceae TaxID=1162 RepID=UPI00168521F7|nr:MULTISPECIES: hypothetical protein [Nostocaceae]MBD2456692.1 hypothetical protein [Nostoc sp. FACHB-87]MBD2478054.1 hypothetical protein [Anabaena sp. FACHB-83]
MNCLEGVGFDRELQQNKYKMIKRQLTKLQDNLNKTTNVRGTMEVRVHKDLFSAIGYYSDSKDLRLVWMYFSNSHDGSEFPAFSINSEELISDADNHFDHLWKKAEKEAEILYISPQINLNYVKHNNSN